MFRHSTDTDVGLEAQRGEEEQYVQRPTSPLRSQRRLAPERASSSRNGARRDRCVIKGAIYIANESAGANRQRDAKIRKPMRLQEGSTTGELSAGSGSALNRARE